MQVEWHPEGARAFTLVLEVDEDTDDPVGARLEVASTVAMLAARFTDRMLGRIVEMFTLGLGHWQMVVQVPIPPEEFMTEVLSPMVRKVREDLAALRVALDE